MTEQANTNPVKPMTDEEWEKKIAAEKAEAIKPDPVEPAKQAAPPAEEPIMDPIEEEIERRVRERMKKEMEQADKNPETPKPVQPAPQPEPPKQQEPAKPVEPPKQPEQPRQEEVKEDKRVNASNDVSSMVWIPLGSNEELAEAIQEVDSMDRRSDQEKQDNPDPYVTRAGLVQVLGQRNIEQRLLERWIKHYIEDHPDAFAPVPDDLRTSKVRHNPAKSDKPVRLSGRNARLAVLGSTKGIVRVQLYNSGIWIELTTPDIDDIQSWIYRVDQSFTELGRIVGGYAHELGGIFLKERLMEIVKSLIVGSNYENYEDFDSLLGAISFQDYETILWALCCMLYPDGVGVGTYCTNKDCRYVDKSQYIDLRKICYLNTEIYPAKAIKWMTTRAFDSSIKVTDEDLVTYKNLLNFRREVKQPGKNRDNVYVLGVPSMKDYLTWESKLAGTIAARINRAKTDTSDDKTDEIYENNRCQMYAPWIEDMILTTNEGTRVLIGEKESIILSMDDAVVNDVAFMDSMLDFIRDTKIAYFTATTLKCPKCGKTTDLGKDTLFPFDVEYLFFDLCCLYLRLRGRTY